ARLSDNAGIATDRRPAVRAAVLRDPVSGLPARRAPRGCLQLPAGERRGAPIRRFDRSSWRGGGDPVCLLPPLRAELLAHVFRVCGRFISLPMVVASRLPLGGRMVRTWRSGRLDGPGEVS